MSSPPKRSLHAATAALQSSSTLTSPSITAALPPAASIARAVSSAAARSRSMSATLAPSRANTSAVARPLPIFSPAAWPAPVTIATFPARRPPPAATSPSGAAAIRARVRLEAGGGDQARDRHVVSDHQQQLDHSPHADAGGQVPHGRLAGGAVDDHFAREAQRLRLLRGEARVALGVALDRLDLRVARADRARDHGVLDPLVG